MTGQDIQDALDRVVEGLQTGGKGRTVTISLRNSDNLVTPYQLSSDGSGTVNAGELSTIQAAVNGIKTVADSYVTARAPYETVLESYKSARAPHESAFTTAANARATLQTTLEGDAAFQTAKTNLSNARTDPAYVSASTSYKSNNVSENYSNLSEASGKYQAI